VIPTTLEDLETAQFSVCFYFGISLLSMLQDDELLMPQNLVINWDNPTLMYCPMDGKLGKENSVQCYRDLYNQLIIPGKISSLFRSFFTLMGPPLTAKVT
jgi:hypothetical protein